MYLVGSDHPLKERCRALLERFIEARGKLVTDAEVFQELLHRYVAIGRHDAIDPAWRALRAVVDDVLPVAVEHVDRAWRTVIEDRSTSARDALHLAVMKAHGIERILSFDQGFDSASGVRRIC